MVYREYEVGHVGNARTNDCPRVSKLQRILRWARTRDGQRRLSGRATWMSAWASSLRLAAFTTCLVAAQLAQADAASPTADEIASRMVRGDTFAWEGARTRVRMLLTDADGSS